MAIRTKPIGARLKSSLVDKIEAYRVDNDLTITEALTAILEHGLESIEPCSNDSSDYQLQTDKLICEVAELRRIVEDLTRKVDRPVTKPKKIEPQCDDDGFHQHVAAVIAKSRESSPHIDLVDREEDDDELPVKGLTDEQLSKATGFSLNVINHTKQSNYPVNHRLELAGYYLNRVTNLWESS